ncbi:RagB/SusD family nutrient uptake outer membrane protein [Pedobacter frigoris]|uniref:RagB/SusD family nutrient uptake outer membrane protein n=1 Tax=Pedobacter frigoris TaxID=2571272 RepID=UPI00293164B7|nr:RagB/SusD family nutrient uptake outer membrane protein [Pedobacter frigoris]
MKKLIILLCIAAMATSCDKQIDKIRPLSKIDAEGQLSTLAGILEATNGTYVALSSSGSFTTYDAPWLNINESRGNNVTLQEFGQINKDNDAFFFRNSNDRLGGQSFDFYVGSYQVIVATNIVLEGIAKFEAGNLSILSAADKDKLNYVKGENLAIRAFTYFNLIRVYGKPYYQNAASSSGVPIKKTSDVKDIPAISTVKEVYDFIIGDLKKSAQLMKANVPKTNSYVNLQTAWGTLSRVYLYMGGSVANPNADFNRAAVAYADSVIDQSNGKYQLLQAANYTNMFGDDETGTLNRGVFSANKEIIWANDNGVGGSSIGQLFHYDPLYDFGGLFVPSAEFKSLLANNDLRKTFLKPNPVSGFVETTKHLSKNMYSLTYSPMIYLRLAEVYLNRAEASAKLNDFAQAKADLKAIHTRAGLLGTDIDNLTNSEVIGAVLKERRIELAFEGHGSFDYFRNGLSMTRIAADNNGTARTINADDAAVVFKVPSN